jgi:hypothetical protein
MAGRWGSAGDHVLHALLGRGIVGALFARLAVTALAAVAAITVA